MKFISLIALCLFVAIQSFGQDPKPITWSFQTTKDSVSANKYWVEIKASIEKDWHIFTDNPGGDGLLIPTSIQTDANKLIKNKPTFETIGHSKTEDMDGIGVVNYFENEVVFRALVETTKDTKLTGQIEFQSCNNIICLPPATVKFSFDLKK